MKKILLLLWFAAFALPCVSQSPLYLKTVSYLNYLKIQCDKKLVGGFSALDYNPDDKKWTIVSDRDADRMNSYMFTPDLGRGNLNKISWVPLKKLNRANVESYRFNKTLGKEFVVVEDDDDSYIGRIDKDNIVRLYPAKPGAQPATKNRGIESLTFMPGSNDMWYAYESGRSTDCKKDTFTTFYKVRYDVKTATFDFKSQKKYTYDFNRCECLGEEQSFDGNNGSGVSEILAYGPDQFLILERCYNQEIKTNTARIVLGKVSGDKIIRKETLFDFKNAPDNLNPGNLEGMAFGPMENDSSRTIYLISDDNNDRSKQTRLIVLSEKEPDKGSSIYFPLDSDSTTLTECDTLVMLKPQGKEAADILTGGMSQGSEKGVAKPKTGLLCRLAMCICKLSGCKPGLTPPKPSTITFAKEGNMISKAPRILRASDQVNIEVRSLKYDTAKYVLNGRFNTSINFLTSQKETSPILKLLQYQSNSHAAAIIATQRKTFYDPYLGGNARYTVTLDAKPIALNVAPNDSLWITTVKIPKATDDRERQNLTLTKINVENKFLQEVFTQTKDEYKSWARDKDFFDTLYAEYRGYATRIDRLQLKKSLLTNAASSCNCPKYTGKLADIDSEICDLLATIKLSQTQLCALATRVAEDNACWMRSWLWYSGGSPKLNPFSKVSVSEFNSQLNKRLAIAEAQLQMYTEFSKMNQADSLPYLEKTLKPRITELVATIASLKALKEKGNERNEETGKWLTNTAQTAQIINKVLLYTTSDTIIHWMNHYDAKDEFRKMNGGDALPERVYEKDVVHGVVHNLAIKQKITSQEKVTKTELRTELDLKLEPLADAFKESQGAVGRLQKSENGRSQFAPDASLPVNCPAEVDLYNSSKVMIEWLNEQTEPPLAEIQEAYDDFNIADSGPVYRSQETLVSESRSALGTNIISYEIFEEGEGKPVVKDQYQTYETVRFWPFISVNYVFGSRASAIYDNTTNSFKTYTEMDNFEVFAGAKWYFGPSNVTRTPKRSKFIRNTVGSTYQHSRGNGFGGKTFIFLGLGVRHKFLKNYGVGAGIDIVPGLSLNGGVNVYFDKKYELVNGIVRKDFDIARFRGFMGLAIDVNVVTRFISLF
ncbi:esterase-like activity of phytase family protein [Dyadobacter sp. CY326]|uniref:esterase-like activity of phytase family protein n=1 Tax=Dyadobacter sp. CY326 TaxID=2907300 RepID=UPI001F16BDEE|nr:esterase-like activity of phytase family protein [Dyadobacter sp. CY326]MCE7066660.1 esterase-like activity of phytase family protein [Dyadobacter sp. CY326]